MNEEEEFKRNKEMVRIFKAIVKFIEESN